MKAIVIDNFGGRDLLKLADVPKPVPGPREVLIRLHAAGVNPVDFKIREGLLRTRMPHQFPIIPGWDAAGVVECAGSRCRRLAPGDAVYAYARKPIIKDGAYAEYLVLPEQQVARKPDALSFAEAAAVPLAALTAHQSLFLAAKLRRGQTALIHAGAGGVGHFAVQLARLAGARVLATAGPANLDFVRALGADTVVDYTAVDFVERVHDITGEGVEVAFDTVGGDVQVRSAQAVRPGGTLVSILAYRDEAALRARGIQTRYVFVSPNRPQLDRLSRLFDQGRLRVHISARLPLAEASTAHEGIEGRHTRGKVVLAID